MDADQHRALVEISRSRTEPANRVDRTGIILAYLKEPSAYAVARAMGEPTDGDPMFGARRRIGVLAAPDDRARSGREPAITPEAGAWLVALACAKPTQFGHPNEPGTTLERRINK